MSLKDERLTLRQVRESIGAPLIVDNFVVKVGPIPSIEIPTNLMSPEQAKKASEALEKCQKSVGYYGELISHFKDDQFLEGAKEFRIATGGVDVKDVLSRVFNDLAPDNQCF